MPRTEHQAIAGVGPETGTEGAPSGGGRAWIGDVLNA